MKMCDYKFLNEELKEKGFLKYEFMKKDGLQIALEVHRYDVKDPDSAETIWIFSEKENTRML